MNKAALLLASSSVYSLSVARGSQSNFDFVYGYSSGDSIGGLSPTAFCGTKISMMISRSQRQNELAKYQEKINLETPISAPNGLRLTRLDTGQSVVIPPLNSAVPSAQYHLVNQSNPVIKKTDVGKTIIVKVEIA